MDVRIKDIYTCVCCPEGYVRGLRERRHYSDQVYGTMSMREIERMNEYVRENMRVIGMKNKKLLMFDLDGTLAASKSPISKEMVGLLNRITDEFDTEICVISGCHYNQFQTQFLSRFETLKAQFHSYYLMPTCGAQLYEYGGYDGGWCSVYDNDLTLREKVRIYDAFDTAVAIYNNQIKKPGIYSYAMSPNEPGPHGEIAEDRGSQVTFSMLGQQAPLRLKENFDPDLFKRQHIARLMRRELKDEFEVRIGGTTSVDVTKKGIDKAFGVRNIIEHLHIQIEEVVFVGDALYEGGNDHAVISTGVECVSTTGPDQTMQILKQEFFGE